MATAEWLAENRQVIGYIPRKIHELLQGFKAERSLKSCSQALIAILNEYFGQEQKPRQEAKCGEESQLVTSLERRIEALEQMVLQLVGVNTALVGALSNSGLQQLPASKNEPGTGQADVTTQVDPAHEIPALTATAELEISPKLTASQSNLGAENAEFNSNSEPLPDLSDVEQTVPIQALKPFLSANQLPIPKVTSKVAPPHTKPIHGAPLIQSGNLSNIAVNPLSFRLNPTAGQMVPPKLPSLPSSAPVLHKNLSARGYVWPVYGTSTSRSGWRRGRNQGIDIFADIGTPIVAATRGVVEYAGWDSSGYGGMVEIRHADGSMTRYAHLREIRVRVGQWVDQGEQIGEIGSTGADEPCLHFEIHLPDQDISKTT